MGNGPRSSAAPKTKTALLLIDVINDMDFEGSESLVRLAEPMARIRRALGNWRSDFRATVTYRTVAGVPGRNVAKLLKPDAKDCFVLKPKQSAFYGATLDTLLRDLGTKTVISTALDLKAMR